MKKSMSRILAMLLAISMLFSLCSITAVPEDGEVMEQPAATEEVSADISEPELIEEPEPQAPPAPTQDAEQEEVGEEVEESPVVEEETEEVVEEAFDNNNDVQAAGVSGPQRLKPVEEEHYADHAILYSDGTLVFQYLWEEDGAHGNSIASWPGFDKEYTSPSSVPWYNYRESIQLVEFKDTTMPSCTAYWFSGCGNLTGLVGIEKLNTGNVVSMCDMFADCSSLVDIDTSEFDTSNVSDMTDMFYNCSRLASLNVSGWDTSNVELMYAMFAHCSSLAGLDLSGWNTRYVMDMDWIFNDCPSLSSLTLGSGFSFVGTSGLRDVPWYNTETGDEYTSTTIPSNKAATYTTTKPVLFSDHAILYSDGTLVFQIGDEADKSHGSVAKMFLGVDGGYIPGMVDAPWSVAEYYWGIKVSAVTLKDKTKLSDAGAWLAYLDMTTVEGMDKLDTSEVKNMGEMFWGCSSLSSLDLCIDTSSVTSMSRMFSDCPNLVTLTLGPDFAFVGTDHGLRNVPWYDTATGQEYTSTTIPNNKAATYTTIKPVFNANTATLYLDGTLAFHHSSTEIAGHGSVIATYDTFDGHPWRSHAADITSVEFVDTTQPTNMNSWFDGCSNLTNIVGLDKLDTSNVTSMYGTFYNCSKLTSLDLSSLDTRNVTDMGAIFFGCSSLTELNVDGWDTSKNTSLWAAFYNCRALESLDLTSWVTTSLTSMDNLFQNCSSLTSLDLSNFDTSKVTSFYTLFGGCTGLTDIDLSGLNTSKVANMSCMFNYCESLTSLDLSSFNTSKVTDMSTMFGNMPKLTDLTLGANFAFVGANHSLRDVPWYCEETGEEFTATTIPSNKAAIYSTVRMMDVTVPISLLVSMDGRGNFITATNATITNNGRYAVQITSVSADMNGQWRMTGWDTNMNSQKVNAKTIAFRIKQADGSGWAETTSSGMAFNQDAFPAIAAGTSVGLEYEAKVPAQASRRNENMMTVSFVIERAPRTVDVTVYMYMDKVYQRYTVKYSEADIIDGYVDVGECGGTALGYTMGSHCPGQVIITSSMDSYGSTYEYIPPDLGNGDPICLHLESGTYHCLPYAGQGNEGRLSIFM